MKLVLNGRIGNVVIEAGESTHPNAMKFKGVLVRVDEPSTKPPGGASGHRIMIPAEVAQRQLHTLLNMGLNYDPDLDTHAQRRKVGTITKAWIDGKDVRVEGIVWKHDFPEAEKDLKRPGLGMSMELVDVDVEDPDASIWTLKDFHFSGATILYRESAAYFRTQAIAAKAEKGAEQMAQKVIKKVVRKTDSDAERIAKIAASVVAAVVAETNKPILSIVARQTKTLGLLAAGQDALMKKLSAKQDEESEEIEAGGEDEIEADGEDMESSDDDMESSDASKKDDAEEEDDSADEDEMEGEGVDKGDLEEVGEAGGDGAKPGHRNDDVENYGSETKVQDKVGKTVSSAAFNALKKQVAKLSEQLTASNKANDKLLKKVTQQEKQLTAAADRTVRRSLDPQIVALLAKHQVDAHDLVRSGEKLAVSEVDAVLASAEKDGVRLTPTDRITIKNKMVDQGLMDEGRVDRRSVR